VRREGNLIGRICTFDNLLWASRRAALGKRSRPDVARFQVDLEGNLLSLRDELRSGGYTPGPHRMFAIRDPKPRTISAAPFRDRVAHHAICRHVAPVLERGLIPDCFANRAGLGTHSALNRCTHLARRCAFALKCDVSRYFPSVDRALLKAQLARVIKCGPTLDLLARIIDQAAESDNAPPYFAGDDLFAPHGRARGIPIGNLTSQHFGNSYLSGFDHWITQELRAPGYLRFVDDFILFSDDRRWLARALPLVRERLAALRLELHPRKCRIVPARCGVEFLGWRIFPDHRLLRRATGVRFQRRLRALVAGAAAGEIPRVQVQASVLSWIGHLRHGDTYGLRTALLERAAFAWSASRPGAPA